ncbi:MAG: hypothetical protein KGL39_21825 [Patescibacteria group bacterium]|nr:hypothetical protein [Patescibacteria group bacterium]
MAKTKEAPWIKPFRFFCSKLQIDSKETGVSKLEFFNSQEFYLNEISRGWTKDIHSFLFLKSRQLGISTISIALDLFWVMIHPGIQGAIITHDEASREDFRAKIERYSQSLPREMRLETSKSNRYRWAVPNGSVLNLMVAGTRAKGTLGRAFGLNFVHGTECSSWGDEEGLAALRNSLAENFPNRLYIFESTARGFNMWERMWEESVEDPTIARAFLGWYLREDQQIAKTDARFPLFWDGQLTEEEEEKSKLIFDRYKIKLKPEQIAWYRWKVKNIGDEILSAQEQPWVEEDAFIMSGSPFFPVRQLTTSMRDQLDTEFSAYRYSLGEDFLATQMEPVQDARRADLRVWEEPDPAGEYILGADPAYGASDDSDRSCIQVFRCYADRLEQVAEYAASGVNTAQFAWIIAHLGGVYRNTLVNLEINGPGTAVWQELLHLRQQFEMGKLGDKARDYGIEDIFGSMRWYFYHRPDSTSSGLALHWKTNFENKRRILNQFKDGFSLKQIILHSVPLLREMQSVTVKQGSIGGDGAAKDDRVMAAAIAIVGWSDWIRRRMISQGRTFEFEQEAAKARAEGRPQGSLSQSIVADFFKRRAEERSSEDDPRKWRA